VPRAADEFELRVETPPGLDHSHRLTGPNYDFRVVLLTLFPQRSSQWGLAEPKAEDKP